MNTLSRWWPGRYLFLLAHDTASIARLGVLLARRLGISGTGCSGLTYQRRRDLARLRWRTLKDSGSAHGYLFDTLVDNAQLVPLSLGRADQLRALICLARPESALSGLLSDATAYGTEAPRRAADRYCERIEWLAAAGPNLRTRALIFPEEMIREQPATLLGAVAIHTGVDALATARPDEAAELLPLALAPSLASQLDAAVGAQLAGRCRAAYEQARSELAQWCPTLNLVEPEAESPARALIIKLGLEDELEDTLPAAMLSRPPRLRPRA